MTDATCCPACDRKAKVERARWIDEALERGEISPARAALQRRKAGVASIVIDWIGWGNALVKQDVVLVGRRTTEQALADFAAQRRVAKVTGHRVW